MRALQTGLLIGILAALVFIGFELRRIDRGVAAVFSEPTSETRTQHDERIRRETRETMRDLKTVTSEAFRK